MEFTWNNVEFKITDIGGGELDKNISNHSHALNCYELHFITGGEGTLVAQGKRYNLASGDFFVTGPNVYHEQLTCLNNKTQDIFIMLQAKNTKKANSLSSAFLERPFFFCRDFNADTAEKILCEYKEKNIDYQSCICALCQMLMTQIVRTLAPRYISYDDAIVDLNEKRFIIIEQFFLYGDKQSLSDLAEKIGVCERQTQRLLKKYYGKSFREIVKSKK